MIRRAAPYGLVTMTLAFLPLASTVITGCSARSRDSVLERNKRLVLQMNDAVWNQGDFDRMDEFFSPDFVRHFLPNGSELRGIDSLREQVRKHRESFPDWKEEIQQIVAEGDLVVIHFVSTGTNEGSWLGSPPTGRTIRIHEVSILRIEDGRVAEQWLLPDLLGIERQLSPPEEE